MSAPAAAAGVDLPGLRAIIGRALGEENRLADAAADTPLLHSGLITSIELVSVAVALEERFGLRIMGGLPAGALTLGAILAALEGRAVTVAPASALTAIHRRLLPMLRRPALALACAAVSFLLIDGLVGLAVERLLPGSYDAFIENGRRLYAYDGWHSQDDFSFAFRHHEIARTEADGRRLILVFGDSGTVGSYFDAEKAIPAQIEAGLSRRNEKARVANLAWYGRLLAKDLMLLELAWDLPLDSVVFTIGDDYFNAVQSKRWIESYRHVSLNWPLFAAFRSRVDAERQGPFEAVERRLRRADLKDLGPLRRLAANKLNLLHYSPFLRHLLGVRLAHLAVPEWQKHGAERYALHKEAEPVIAGLAPADVDDDQIALLETTVLMLRKRGVKVILYVEPRGPSAWPTRRIGITAGEIASGIAARTSASVVDLSQAVSAEGFTDHAAHYPPDTNRMIGERIAAALAKHKGGPRGQ